MMWWKNKDGVDGKGSPNQTKKTAKNSNRRQRRGNRGNTNKNDNGVVEAPSAIDEQEMHIGETVAGIEVSLSHAVVGLLPASSSSSLLSTTATPSTAVSLQQSLGEILQEQHRRVHRTQFSVSSWPVFEKEEPLPSPSLPQVPVSSIKTPGTSRHRVPLAGSDNKSSSTNNNMLYQDVLELLTNQEPVNETACVQQELKKMNYEMEALEEDRAALNETSLKLPGQIGSGSGGGGGGRGASGGGSSLLLVSAWEIHRILSAKQQRILSAMERDELQEKRGHALSVCLHDDATRQAFVNKCSPKVGMLKNPSTVRYQSDNTNDANHDAIITLDPDNCRDGGAAATIQHVQLLTGSSTDTSFFVSRDSGKGHHWGHLPDKLYRRMKSAGMDPKGSASDLIYLSTGPLGAYYAEFRSGECWWGSPLDDDDDFHAICSEWDVYRVSFGPTKMVSDSRMATSWIILGRDGRAAWKNIPVRLHNKLESRMANEAAPAEVTLGSGDSYFIRFLDDATDFMLPAHVARVCQKMEQQNVNITSVSLHPELSHDFVIRHCDISNGQVHL